KLGKTSSAKTLLWVGGGMGAVVLVAAVVVIVLLIPRDKKKTEPPPATPTMPVAAVNLASNQPIAIEKKEDSKADKDRKPAGKQVGASKNDIYRHVLKSTGWVVNLMSDQRAATGTGTVIDKRNRLLLTNYHVVYRAQQVLVLFPIY